MDSKTKSGSTAKKPSFLLPRAASVDDDDDDDDVLDLELPGADALKQERSKSVTFSASLDVEDVRKKLQRTPTPFWTDDVNDREMSVDSGSVDGTGSGGRGWSTDSTGGEAGRCERAGGCDVGGGTGAEALGQGGRGGMVSEQCGTDDLDSQRN